MDWLLSITRVAGASFPVASSLVQLQSEIDAKSLLVRVAKLEDPVSHLHKDIPKASRIIYQKLKEDDSNTLNFENDFYKQYSRALAVLESQGYIKGGHALGQNYAEGITLIDPSYIMYLCALEEDANKMESLIKQIEACAIGDWLNGNVIKATTGLPIPTIMAVFEIFESKGYGLCSQEIGSCMYMGKA